MVKKETVTSVSFDNPVKEGMLFGVGFMISAVLLLIVWEIVKAILIAFMVV